MKINHFGKYIAILDSLAGVVALAGLLPIAGFFSVFQDPVLDGAQSVLSFVINLAGPLLMLAAGLNFLFKIRQQQRFIAIFIAVVCMIGSLRLGTSGFYSLIPAWLVLCVIAGILLASLRRASIWVMVGGSWTILLLTYWCLGGVLSYISAQAPQTPTLLLIQLMAFGLSLLAVAMHLFFRKVFTD